MRQNWAETEQEMYHREVVYAKHPYAYQDHKGNIWADDFYNCDSHMLSSIENVEGTFSSFRERCADNWRIAAGFGRDIDPEAQIDTSWLRSFDEFIACKYDYKKFILGEWVVPTAKCPYCGMLPEEHKEGNASCVNFPSAPKTEPDEAVEVKKLFDPYDSYGWWNLTQEQYEECVLAGWQDYLEGKGPPLGPHRLVGKDGVKAHCSGDVRTCKFCEREWTEENE